MPRKKPGKVGENKFEVIRNIPHPCANERAAVEFIESQRWEDTPCCPHCGDTDVYQMKGRDGEREKNYRWRCKGCGERYTVRTGTVMAETRMPLRYWCHAFWRVCASKKGVSAKQIQRETGLSYKSALFLLHRVRFAMADMDGVKLSGTVEVDETYTGGKLRFRGPHNKRGRGTSKQPVMAMVERGGRVKSRVIADVTAATLRAAVNEHVERPAHLMSDENPCYVGLAAEYASHQSTKHSAKEYVRGDVHSNTAESVFAVFKRGVYGVYHNISKKHLHRYLAEFDFRWNTRKDDDGERTAKAIQSAVGKRLMYQGPCAA